MADVDEYATLRPGTRVEALMSGTQGTWYIARIVEFASFPQHYIDGDTTEPSDFWLPMVCVHYEGTSPSPQLKQVSPPYNQPGSHNLPSV